jgi:hypothetical protein
MHITSQTRAPNKKVSTFEATTSPTRTETHTQSAPLPSQEKKQAPAYRHDGDGPPRQRRFRNAPFGRCRRRRTRVLRRPQERRDEAGLAARDAAAVVVFHVAEWPPLDLQVRCQVQSRCVCNCAITPHPHRRTHPPGPLLAQSQDPAHGALCTFFFLAIPTPVAS